MQRCQSVPLSRVVESRKGCAARGEAEIRAPMMGKSEFHRQRAGELSGSGAAPETPSRRNLGTTFADDSSSAPKAPTEWQPRSGPHAETARPDTVICGTI